MKHLVIQHIDYQTYHKNFALHLEALGYRPATRQMLLSCVQEFLHYHEQNLFFRLEGLSECHFRHYDNYLQQRPSYRKPDEKLSNQMIRHHRYSLNLFFAFLEQSGSLAHNPYSGLELDPLTVSSRDALSQEAIQSLYQVCENPLETALLHLYYGCGLRRKEGEKLNTEDVHLRQQRLYVHQGKGDRSRIIPLSQKIVADLKDYLFTYRNKGALPGTQAFLIHTKGGRMRGNSANHLLKKLLERAGLPLHYSLHHLRHSIATHLLQQGMSLEQVQTFLGHRHPESTQIYTHLKEETIRL